MKKLLFGLLTGLVLLASVFLAGLGLGVIDTSSYAMVANVLFGLSGPPIEAEQVQARYRVPEGFALTLYAGDLPQARFLRFTPSGHLLVSRRHSGDIVRLSPDGDGDGQPDAQDILLDGLRQPQGIDVHGDWLYIAESHRVGRAPLDPVTGELTGPYEPVVEGLTDNGNHPTKTLRFGPDGKLYLTQGSSCNVCTEEDPRRGSLMRFEADGTGGEIVASGLRNSVGFDWAPWSDSLYATDNGRDMLGDDFPPCELNHIEAGGFYGWPFFNGDNVPDPDMGTDPQAAERDPIAPEFSFRAHNAPLGITFPDTQGWPADFERSALVALHGSWNRSSPDGYKVVSLHWTDSGIEQRDFLTGFLWQGEIGGRPVDIAQGPDGAVYVSDDYAGAVYRIAPGKAGNIPVVAPTRRSSRLDQAPPAWLAGADLATMSARGEALYAKYDCSQCHESDNGTASLENLADRLGYAAVLDTLQAPQAPMPLYPLSEEERRQLAVFLLQR
jgi:glucose/arabinose dehydrogenase